MTDKNYTPLPYSFDLLYDIKSVEELHAHLTGKERCATSGTDAELVQAMIEHHIPMPDGFIPKSLPTVLPEANYTHYVELLQLVRQLYKDAKEEHRNGLEVLDARSVMLKTGRVLANQPGLNEEQIKEYQNPNSTLKKNSL